MRQISQKEGTRWQQIQRRKSGSRESRRAFWRGAFTDSLNTWLGVLGNAGFVTFMCNGVAARLHDPAFADSLNTWLGVLGPKKFASFVRGSCACRLTIPAFTDSLSRWLRLLGPDKFVAIISRGLAARWTILDEFIVWLVSAPRWTQKMTDALCQHVPVGQTTPIDPSIYQNLARDM
jgi:hypothetical protein